MIRKFFFFIIYLVLFNLLLWLSFFTLGLFIQRRIDLSPIDYISIPLGSLPGPLALFGIFLILTKKDLKTRILLCIFSGLSLLLFGFFVHFFIEIK
jgi:hypothetical protein